MPWSYRKSIKAGPFRINLSKSGVGYSVGGKALRYGKTAKGRSYVSSSPLPGLRYQQTISPPPPRTKQSAPVLIGSSPDPMGPGPGRMSQGRLALIIAGLVVGVLVILGLIGAATNGNVTPTVAPRPATATTPATVAVAPILAATPNPTAHPSSPAAAPTLLAPTAIPATPPQTVTVTTANAVNVRSGPDTDADVLSQVLPGNDATVIDADVPSNADDSHWVHVSVNGMEGYIRKDLVGASHTPLGGAPASPAPNPVAPPPRASATPVSGVVLLASTPVSPNRVSSSGLVVTVISDGTGEKINIRSAPDMSAPVLAQVSERDEIQLTDMSDTVSADTQHWLKVNLDNGAVGYIRRDLVSGPHVASNTIPTATPTSVRPAAPATYAVAPSGVYSVTSGGSGYSRPATGFYTDRQGRVRPITSSGGRHR